MNEHDRKSFDNPCTCGGYAWQMNGRNPADPHMSWCKQREEYKRWYAATKTQKRPPHEGA